MELFEKKNPLKKTMNGSDGVKMQSQSSYQNKQLESLHNLLKTESFKKRLFLLLLEEKDINHVVEPVLDYIGEIIPGNIRCVIQPAQENTYFSQEILFKLGSKAEEFSYLDEQISQLLQSRRHVLISDTTKSRELKFSQNKPYPMSVAAFPLKTTIYNHQIGFLWIGKNETCDFSRGKLRPIFELIDALSSAIHFYLIKSKDKFNFDTLSTIVNSIDEPLMLISNKFEVIWSNQLADKLFSKNQTQELKSLSENTYIEKIKNNLIEKKGEFQFEIGSNAFKVIDLLKNEMKPDRNYLLRFVNKTDELQNIEFLSLLLKIINDDLNDSILHLQGLVALVKTQGIINEHQNESIEKIDGEIYRIYELVSRLLNVKRFQENKKLLIERIETRDIINQALIKLSLEASQKGIIISQENVDYEIQADSVLIEQAIINLIDNAIKYSHLCGEIKIRELITEKFWQIEIIDHGKGMSPMDVKQLEDHSRLTESSMRGFDIASEIAKLHNGYISVESNLGEGTRVVLNIPMS